MGISNKVSVRLTPEAQKKLNEALAKGHSKSEFINAAILNTETKDMKALRSAAVHLVHIESELEFVSDPEIKRNLRKEVNALWHCLK